MSMIKIILSLFFFSLLLISCETDFTSNAASISQTEKKRESESEKKTDSSETSFPEEKKDSEADENRENEEIDDTQYEVTEDEPLFIEEEIVEPVHREWTVLVYMAADNNLEGDAVTDFNEMEVAEFGEEMSVLLLFDRSEKYDATNGDWAETRLYKVDRDQQLNKTLIASEEVDCEELGLKVGQATELDMANPATLSAFLRFARRAYEADNYALIIWGHGTGWRNAFSENPLSLQQDSFSETGEKFRAVAIDGTSDSYMSISQLRSAIEDGMQGEKLAFIGFDTCFGMCLEAAYELSDCALFMLGTPALVPESGWDYKSVFSDFFASGRTTEAFIDAISKNYERDYKNYAYASFSCISLSLIPDLVDSLSSYSRLLADSICDKNSRDLVFNFLTSETVSYCATTYPTDFSVDLLSLSDAAKVCGLDIGSASAELKESLSSALIYSWSAAGLPVSLGVFFCIYKNASCIQGSHPSLYFNGSRDTLLSRFVSDCSGYVPSISNHGSLLDKLFYTNFYSVF